MKIYIYVIEIDLECKKAKDINNSVVDDQSCMQSLREVSQTD